MKVLIFGGRNFRDQSLMQHHLDQFYIMHGHITYIIHGDASGADSMGKMFARNWLGIPDLPFPADWKNVDVPGAVIKTNQYGDYNAIAGYQRNQRMIDEGQPDFGMGFPGGSGTADMLKRLEAAGVPIWNGGCE